MGQGSLYRDLHCLHLYFYILMFNILKCLLVNRTMSLKSYSPRINCSLNKEIKFGLNITGYTTERLLKNIIKLIRDRIGYALIELIG